MRGTALPPWDPRADKLAAAKKKLAAAISAGVRLEAAKRIRKGRRR